MSKFRIDWSSPFEVYKALYRKKTRRKKPWNEEKSLKFKLYSLRLNQQLK